MNKVFKVIWNHATQTWTAVSELGHAKGKTKSKKIVKLTALAGAVMGVVGTAQAVINTDASTITISSANPNNIVGTNQGKNNINIGTGANTYRTEPNNVVSHDAIAIGTNATGKGDASVAIGLDSKAVDQSAVAIGQDTKAMSINAVAIGQNVTATANHALAMSTDANASGVQSIAIGSYSNATADSVVAIGQNSNAGGAAGANGKGPGTAAVAVGYLANASAANTVAAGKSATATVDNAIAVGVSTAATARNAAALGGYATATAERATAVGAASKASGTASFAGGTSANASGINSVAIGGSMTPAEAAQATGANTTAIGTGAKASDNNAVALGSGSVTKTAMPNASQEFFKKRYTFAGGNPDSVVSFGSLDHERQLVNVAAGRINSSSTDAINGSQLYAVTEMLADHQWIVSGNTTTRTAHQEYGVKRNDIVDFEDGKGTTALIRHTPADISSGEAGKTYVTYNVNLVDGKNTKVKFNSTTNTYQIDVDIVNSSTGATGAKGEKGDTGPAGPKGDTGATGATGEKGDKGDSALGLSVDVQDDNANGTHTITINNLDDGSVTTTIVKDGKNGKDGKDGATGAKGEKGDTGAAGAKGDTGAKGEKGDTGAAGAKGEKGDTGAVGAKGDTGAKGEKGDTGAAGAKGDKGDKGDKGEDGVMTWDIKSTGNKAEGSEEAAKTIKHKNTVDMAAGKNLTVKQTSDENGAKVEFALNSTVTNLDKVVVNGPKGPKGPNGEDGEDGKDGVTITAPVKGKDGLDGKVGISGKDGKDAVSISGKDGVGQIGLTGPKGKDGKDGASINITTDNGKQTLVNKEVGADGKKDQAQRIIYVPTDKDGNPLKDEKGNTIKREVATMDDGLTFVGNEGSHDAALGTEVKVKGATDNKDWSKFDAGKNIMTKVEGDTITVGLANDLDVNNVKVANNVTAGNVTATGTISAPTIKAGDTTITNGKVANLKHHIENPTTVVDDKVLNVSEDVKKEAATVRDVLNSGWNLQANGNAVDAVTHGNTVNFVNGKGITVTAEPNEDGTTSKVSFDVNVDNDTITVNDKGQLVSNGSTNFNVATKDGGNKVAKKGGSSTAKITSGKTITYTAGKNIAIEQNGGDILVSTTDDVNHNSVTTKDLTVNKGGNVDMGGNQVHNVKAGTKDTDAVNVSQLKQSVGDVHKRINKVGKEARGGIAGANAAAGLPQVYIPGKSMVAASAGTFKGESAVAVGYSRSSDNGKVIFKLQGNANTQGDVGGSVGVGYQW